MRLLLCCILSLIVATSSAPVDEETVPSIEDMEARIKKLEDHFARQSETNIYFDAYLGLGTVDGAYWPGGEQIIFQSTNTNSGDGWNLGRSEFITPVSGPYAFFFSAECIDTYNHCHLELRKNGEMVNDGFHDDSTDDMVPTQTFWFTVLNLEEGDRISVATQERTEGGDIIEEDVLYYALNHIRFYGYLIAG